jgi:hypothetical protein
MSDLRTPWTSRATYVYDVHGETVAGVIRADVAAEIVRLVNREAERLAAKAEVTALFESVVGPLDDDDIAPSTDQIRSALAQGRDDRRRVREASPGQRLLLDRHRAELERRTAMPATSSSYRERFGVQVIATGATEWHATNEQAWNAMGDGKRIVTRSNADG